jgi:HEAT repeat protein
MDRLAALATADPAAVVRAAAASALGHYILMGELGDMPEHETARAQAAAIQLLNDESEELDVRRRALEAIANRSHEIVPGAIRAALRHQDRRMQVSALFAMGRSCDERWSADVLRGLDSPDADLRYEAARAAGEIELEEAVPRLRQLVFGDDREIKEVAVWSLGEIGGDEAIRTLQRLAQDAENSGDDELLEAIEEALASASLGSGSLYLMNLDD